MRNLQRFEAKILANEAHKMLSLQACSYVDIFKAFKDHPQIHLMFAELESGDSGFTITMDGLYLIAINSSHSLGRQRFTAAHELFHILYDSHLEMRSKATEHFADSFASYFLIPDELLVEHLGQLFEKKKSTEIDEYVLVAVSDYFRVSVKAVLVRLLFEGYITKENYEKLKQMNVHSVAARYGFDSTIFDPVSQKKSEAFLVDLHSDYAEKARLLFENKQITYSKYLQYLSDAKIPVPKIREKK